MGEKFLNVFSSLKLNDDLKDAFSEVSLDRVTASPAGDEYRFYISANYLLEKELIFKMEDQVLRQLDPKSNISVHFVETYHLSEMYNAKNLWEIYKPSLLEEYKRVDPLAYGILRDAKEEFTGEEELTLHASASILSDAYADRMKREIEHLFIKRFGIHIVLHFIFDQEFEYKYLKETEYKFQHATQVISNRLYRMEAEEEKKAKSEAKKDGEMNGALDQGKNGTVEGKKLEGDQKSSKESGEKKSGDGSLPAIPEESWSQYTNDSAKSSNASSGNGNGNGKAQGQEGRPSYGSGNGSSFRGGVSRGYGRYQKSDNPDVLWGRDFEEEPIGIHTIVEDMGEVVIAGMILSVEERQLRNEKTIILFGVTDFTDTLTCKQFVVNDQLEEMRKIIKSGNFIKLKGVAAMDRFDHEIAISNISGIKKGVDTRVFREDDAFEKRVELHLHTNMSEMDGVSSADTMLRTAIRFGHRAMAVTDHGVVQGFTEALHSIKAIKDKYEKNHDGEKLDFKVIYGVEAYLADDLKTIAWDIKGQTLDDRFVVFDIETTGFSADKDTIIEIGAVRVEHGEITDHFSTFINPRRPIPRKIEELTHINDSMVMNADPIEVVLPKFIEFCGDDMLVAHNAEFDTSFIKAKAKDLGMIVENTIVDTLPLSRTLLPNLNRFTLDSVAKNVGVSLGSHHRAVDDAECTAGIFVEFIARMKKRGISKVEDIDSLTDRTDEWIRKLRTHHATILVTSEVGRVNLYHLISDSHLRYYNLKPKIPKSEFLKYREGLLIGSGCCNGELFDAVLNGRSEEEIARIVEFYDFLEIQPPSNNLFMIEDDGYSIHSREDIEEVNRKIVALGEKFNKMVVATGDVHFAEPEDEIYRSIIHFSTKMRMDVGNLGSNYYRTTDEMLKEFEFLGMEKAKEVVVTNSNKICDLCDPISPVSPEKCPPVIENSNEELREICYNHAKELYGDPIPSIVLERLDKELNSIISNGYSVMYIIAQKLVWKSNEDGYLVGSRGSVGSSLAATMSGITEVNPLPPHYLCPNCKYVDFTSEEVKKYAGGSGCDMPDKICPHCGTKLNKEGHDIPFETFLGFDGDKEPDIDLNFSSEYQSKAHDYTEVIFGKGQTFKAGTIGTVADKTAYGYVAKYYETKGEHKRSAEIARIAQGCTGVKRTTGQHPGGIVVLPIGHDINTFTPVQHPANEITSHVVTTHFDYHSIDHNLLKLDILGHDDPTMIRMLQDLTGVDPKDIPLDSPEVMSLFQGTEILGITPDDIPGTKLGCLGIPEFGTDFAMQMLIDTKPQHFSDLVRIAGLSHGTDVWLGNAQVLIAEGKCTISSAICTRDDIMVYLISMGLEAGMAFKIMEAVRKGKVAGKKEPKWEVWKAEMVKHGVPDWYIWSCEKIQYMFPKAHAAAYVMMAWRIAYCKVFYPLAYYAAYYSNRAKAFSYELMCMGKEKLEIEMERLRRKESEKTIENKEADQLKDMRLVQEMYARGIEFEPIDIFRAKAKHFQIVTSADGKQRIMPSLSAIDGLGDNVANAIEEGAKGGEFLSKEDFRLRTKASSTQTDLLDRLGILGSLPESNQLSLFDFMK
ncbi:MAG: PolC-type DNA polymerase III [Lachnospiraceae bacterium]|nr:PolC-type DNA polymerase III [Lachnospiraceae bacterium]